MIFLTGHGTIPMTVRAIKAGAVDFLTKPVKKADLLSAVERALDLHAGQRALQEQLNGWRTRLEALTGRQRQVFGGVVSGKLNKQIAAELGVAERTVKAHRSRVMEKMHARSVAELVHIVDLVQGDVRSTGGARPG